MCFPVVIDWWRAQCSIIEYRGYKIVYRRYASLFFIVGIDAEEVRRAVVA